MTIMSREKRNRLCELINGPTTEALQALLAYYLKEKNKTLTQFIDDNQHDIYHLHRSDRCCLCPTINQKHGKRQGIPPLQKDQFELIFNTNYNAPRNNKHRPGKTSDVCCCSAKRICVNDLDITLIKCLFINFCQDFIWDNFLGVSHSGSFNQFLQDKQHDIFHLCHQNFVCCKCNHDNYQIPSAMLHKSDFDEMYDFIKQKCNIVDTCAYCVKPGLVHYSKISVHAPKLFSELTKYFCPLHLSIHNIGRIRNKLFHGTNTMQEDYDVLWEKLKNCVLEIETILKSQRWTAESIDELKSKSLNNTIEQKLNEMKERMDLANNNLDVKVDNIHETIADMQGNIQRQNLTLQSFQDDMTELRVTGASIKMILERHNVKQRNIELQENGGKCESKTKQFDIQKDEDFDFLFNWRQIQGMLKYLSIYSWINEDDSSYSEDYSEKDTFICKCGMVFHQLFLFLPHKSTCNSKKSKMKKYNATKIGDADTYSVQAKLVITNKPDMPERWKESVIYMQKRGKDSFDIDGMTVEIIEDGSLVVWAKLDEPVVQSKTKFVDTMDKFMINLLSKCPITTDKNTTISINVDVIEATEDEEEEEEEETDIYQCGRCKETLRSLSTFTTHKKKCDRSRMKATQIKPLLHPSFLHQYANNEAESTEQCSTDYINSLQNQTDLRIPPTQQSDEDPRLCHKNDEFSTCQPTGDPRYPNIQNDSVSHHLHLGEENGFTDQQDIRTPFIVQPGISPSFSLQMETNAGIGINQQQSRFPFQQQQMTETVKPTQPSNIYQPQAPQHPYRQLYHQYPRYEGYVQQLTPFGQSFYMGMLQQGQYRMHQAGYSPYGGYYSLPYQPYGGLFQQDGIEDEGISSFGSRNEDHTQQDSRQNILHADIPMDDSSDSGQDSNTEEDNEYPEKSKMLKVSKIPQTSTEDTLIFFFENTRKFGGGDIESIAYDKTSSTAIITFEEDDGVEKVLNKVPIYFGKTILDVEAYSPDKSTYDNHTPPESDSDTETLCTIEVSGMKKTTTEDTVMYYFESRKGAHDDVKSIEFVENTNMYLVNFENAEEAKKSIGKEIDCPKGNLEVNACEFPCDIPEEWLQPLLYPSLKQSANDETGSTAQLSLENNSSYQHQTDLWVPPAQPSDGDPRLCHNSDNYSTYQHTGAPRYPYVQNYGVPQNLQQREENRFTGQQGRNDRAPFTIQPIIGPRFPLQKTSFGIGNNQQPIFPLQRHQENDSLQGAERNPMFLYQQRTDEYSPLVPQPVRDPSSPNQPSTNNGDAQSKETAANPNVENQNQEQSVADDGTPTQQPRNANQAQTNLAPGQVPQHPNMQVRYQVPRYWGPQQQFSPFRQGFFMGMPQQGQYGMHQAGYSPYGGYYPPPGNHGDAYQQQFASDDGHENQRIEGQGIKNEDHNQQGSDQTMEETVPNDDWEVIGNDSNNDENKDCQHQTKMLKVSKIPQTSTEDTLIFFFENTRKYGGGDIESISYDKRSSTAIITFAEDGGVEKVLKKVPICFGKTILEVEAYIPDKSLQNESTEDDYSSPESDFEAETVCTIVVSGMKKTTTEDTVMYYFESRKGAHADVKSIEFVENKNMYLVTFENEEDVNTVMAKEHRIDGTELHVKNHVPPKRYPNKVLISGLGENISSDGLINFLEAKTKIDVETVEMGEEGLRKAIVTFEKSIDIEKIQASIKNKSYIGNHLKVHPVEVSNCIIVRGYSEETTYEAIENYFDNKRRSGVENVTECKMNEEENYCVIYFEDPKDAIVATQREHVVSNCTLSVNIFYDCLGIPTDNEEGSMFKPLPPVTVHNFDKQKVKFMLHLNSIKEEFQKQLHKMHAEVHWPSYGEESILTIHPTLTRNTKDWQKISKTWEVDVRKEVDVFSQKLLVEKLNTLQESWDQVMNKVREIDIPNPDNVILRVEKPPICEIQIVGITSDVAAVSRKIKNVIDEITEDLNIKKQQVTEDVQLKHHQLVILDLTDFPSNTQNTLGNIEININIEALKIKFKGISSSVVSAKLQMYEVTGSISSTSLGSKSPEFIQFLDKPKVTKSVLKRMKDQQCIGVWEVHNRKITLYSTSDEKVSKVAEVFKDSIIETKVDVDNFQKSLLHSKMWIQHLKAIEDECHRKLISVKIIADKQEDIILLCTSKAETAAIKEEIQNFFYSNTEIELKLEVEKSKLKFLQEYMKDEVENLERRMKQQQIIVAVKSDNVLVKANQEGIQEAQKCVNELVKNIYRTENSVDKPGLHKLMDTDKGKSKMKMIGKQAGVIISIEGGDRSIQGSKSSTNLDGRVIYIAAGGQEVIVIKADITALSVDVIVNAANKDLVHTGGLAKVLINKGGISIQHECDQYTKHHGQLSEGEVFCSGPGSLHCKHIVHAVGPIWQGGRNKEEVQLYDCVTTSLEETDKRNLSSIAIPALCTGIFGYPASEATKVITESVRDYFKRPHSSSIKTVFLCDIVTSTVDLFVKAANKFFNQPDSKYHSTPGRGRSANRFEDASHNKGRQNITSGNIKIKIRKEDLNKMKVDVIVNTTSRDLELSKGIVSASLLKHGGSVLQRECYKKHPNGVEYGEVAVTSGGRLHCKIVCHGSLEQWKSDGSSIKVFESFIMNCLHTADKKGFRSIAFPAMGTGKLNYPRDLVAKHMYKCVEDFSSKNPKSTITEVFFVLYHKDHLTVQAFEDQEKIQQKSRVEHETPTTFQGKGNKKPADDKVYSINLGKLVLKVYQGDITAVQVEVIVNSSNTNLDMSLGDVSKAILQKGGDKIKKQLLSQKRDMKNDGIAVTACKGSGLLCDVVIHVDMQDTTRKLKEKITYVLEKTEELGKISVAFPALGTSNANITIKDAAEEMYIAVRQFQSTSPQHVKEVHVVIFKNDHMKTFMETIKACVSTGNKKGWMDYVYDYAIDYLGYGQLSDNQTKILTETRPKMSMEKQSTAVTFVIYAKNKKDAERAVTVLETELDQEYVSRKIKDKMVAQLNSEQITALKFIGKSDNVEIHVDKGNKEIVLTGIIDNISSAMTAANKIIKTAQEQTQLNQKAKLVTDMVQWSFVEEQNGKKTFVEFPHDVNLLLEEAFRDDSSKVTFLASDGSKMVIDLTSYKMFPEDDPTDNNGVIRKTKLVSDSDFKPPDHWDDMADDEYIKIVPLVQSSTEYNSVLTEFNKTGGTSYTVVKIERIQNKVLNQQYIAKKSLMDATNPPGYQNERRPVWHGTNKQALENIINTGFNRSYCNVTAYGKGVYFAVNVSYSASGYSSVDPTDGLKRMLMCKVLAGEYTVGNSAMKTPPPKTQSAAGSHILYDSTTNNVTSPIMFVIYHDSQAVAEYRVTFK